MDDVDDMLLQALRKLNLCDIDEQQSLGDFPSNLFCQAVVRCIRVIDPGLADEVSEHMPAPMAARYAYCSALASKIQACGYKGDVGYQTLLYANATSMRHILIFLLEHLPRHESDAGPSSLKTPAQQLRDRITLLGRKLTLNPPLPPFLRSVDFAFDVPGKKYDRCRLFRPLDETFKLGDSISVSSVTIDDLPASLVRLVDLMKASTSLAVGLSPGLETKRVSAALSTKPPKPVKPARFSKPAKPQLPPKPGKIQSPEPAVLDGAFDSAQQQDAVVMARLQQLESSLVTLRNSLSALKRNRAEAQAQLDAKTTELKRKERIAVLNNEEAAEKLKSFISNADERMDNLRTQWQSHSDPLRQQIFNAQHVSSEPENEAQAMQLECKDMKTELQEVFDELTDRADYVASLRREADSMGNARGRGSYTRRILDIVASIRKQRDQIDKILADTRSVQHDIQTLTGRLDRTMTATDDLLFKGMQSEGAYGGDDAAKRAYKLMMSLHENCVEIRAIVEESGDVKREMREVEDEIENEKQKEFETNLESILRDFEAVYQENESLRKQAKS